MRHTCGSLILNSIEVFLNINVYNISPGFNLSNDISTVYVNYGSTVTYTYDGLLFACPLLTINWNVKTVGYGTIGAINIGLEVL